VALSYTHFGSDQVNAVSGVTTSTSAFSPVAGQYVVLTAGYMFSTNTPSATFTVADNHGNTYTALAAPLDEGGFGGGFDIIAAFAYNSSPGSTTVKITASSTGTAAAVMDVLVFSGAAASQPGPNVLSSTSSGTASTAQGTLTTTVAGSYVVLGGAAGGNTTMSVISGTTALGAWNNVSIGASMATAVSTSVTGTPGSTNFGWTFGGSVSFGFSILGVEVLPAAGGSPDMPRIAPGLTWFDTFKPGLRKPRPVIVAPAALEQGPLNVTLPPPVTSLTGTDVNPASLPAIQPGPTWFDTFKPGMRRPRSPAPPSFAFSGDTGPLNITLPAPMVSLTGVVNLPLDVPRIQPGPTWLDMFKPGTPRPRPPVPPVAVRRESGLLAVTLPPPVTSLTAVRMEQGPLAVLLPSPVTSISSREIRVPENLGAVLTLPGPDGVTVEVLEGASFTLADYGATLVLPGLGGSLIGWTMQTAPLNLLEFNDVTIDIAVTQNGSPYNLTGVTVNLLFKTAAGTPDANALVFSSGGGSPAITITNAAGGLAVATIPNTDLDNEVYFFYRLDVVNAGLTNTCLSGPITWTSL